MGFWKAVWFSSPFGDHCKHCICHGDTIEAITLRFRNNILSGKFLKTKRTPVHDWDYQHKTVTEKEVKKN